MQAMLLSSKNITVVPPKPSPLLCLRPLLPLTGNIPSLLPVSRAAANPRQQPQLRVFWEKPVFQRYPAAG